MKPIMFAAAFCVLIAGCSIKSETVVQKPTQPTTVVYADPAPPAVVYVPR
jgi:hypothetical protein